MKNPRDKSAAGFSVLEMMAVVSIIIIMTTFALLSLTAEKLYDTDKQAIYITDLLQEARQRSLSQRNTVRVEINKTKKQIRLIDEKKPNTSTDDVLVKSIAYMSDDVLIGTAPSNMSASPVELTPVPNISFTTSTHPLSSGNQVAVMRFLKNGNVTNAGTNDLGAGAVPTGATIYVWSKFPSDASPTPTVAQIFRAVTVLAASGSTRLWKCTVTSGNCDEWVR